MTSYKLYQVLEFLTWKKHNTIKQYFNRNGIKVTDTVNFTTYLNKYGTK